MKHFNIFYNFGLANHNKKEETNMRRLLLIGLLVFSMFAASLPTQAQTYEQAKKIQAEKALASADGAKIKAAVNKYSDMYKVDPLLIHAIILTESGYNKNAVSPCGARGLGQFMPATFRARNVGNNIFDIDQNVHATAKHTSGLLAKYNGNVYLTLSAYNIGGGAVDRYKGQVHPATRNYVNRVLHHKKILETIQM